MLGARAMALVRLGQFDEAADWGVKAAARPNAHPHILAIAAYSLALAGSPPRRACACRCVARPLPRYTVADFLAAFQFDPQGTALFRKGAGDWGQDRAGYSCPSMSPACRSPRSPFDSRAEHMQTKELETT